MGIEDLQGLLGDAVRLVDRSLSLEPYELLLDPGAGLEQRIAARPVDRLRQDRVRLGEAASLE
jgi:hypothetical protein